MSEHVRLLTQTIEKCITLFSNKTLNLKAICLHLALSPLFEITLGFRKNSCSFYEKLWSDLRNGSQ